MNTGTFINYQLAEALLLLHSYQKSNKSLAEFEVELTKLKEKWKKDTMPSTGSPIPDLYIMQSITIDQLIQIDSKIDEYDSFSTENAANMQSIIKTSDGVVKFDFSYLDSIVQLAREKGKKVIIDSAVVFGDHFPEIFKRLNKEELTFIIRYYISELTSRYGDTIARIDVLNSIFERKDVKSKDGMAIEDFWISIFGENYGKEIIKNCKESLKANIPLCWNEFYITNPKYADRKTRFLSIILGIENLNIIGIQDTFQDSADPEYTLSVLKEIEDICLLTDKKAAITELSCRLSKDTVIELYDVLNNNPTQMDITKSKVEGRINTLIEHIIKHVSESPAFTSVEGRISKEFDFNAFLLELRGLREKGIRINTVGNNWNKLLRLINFENEKSQNSIEKNDGLLGENGIKMI